MSNVVGSVSTDDQVTVCEEEVESQTVCWLGEVTWIPRAGRASSRARMEEA